MNVNFNGLQYCAKQFEEDGMTATGGKWKIARGGYDLDFEVYFNNTPVAGYYEDGFENYGHLSDRDFTRLMHTIGTQMTGIKEVCINEEEKEMER